MTDAINDTVGGMASYATDDGGDDPPSHYDFVERFTISVGTTVVEEKSTGEEIVMWKADSGEYSSVDSHPVSAVMAVVEAEEDGVI